MHLLMKKTKDKQNISIPRWGRFEGQISYPIKLENPYSDETLEAVYFSPSGREYHTEGFHDGGDIWRYRFMPDETGNWRYHVAFNDSSVSSHGTFHVAEGDIPGLISRQEGNPIWFGFKGGQRIFVRGFHVGDRFFASNWPDSKREAFLDYAQEQGYNLLSIASFFLNRDVENRGRGWKTPKLWPIDAGEYKKLERVLDQLAARRMLLFPFAGFFGQNSCCPETPHERRQYLRYILARVGSYWNLLFNVAGPEPNLKYNPWMPIKDVLRLGEWIAELDVHGHLLSVHNETGDDEFKHCPWETYGTLQGPKTVDQVKLGKAMRKNHHWEKPLFAQETLWTGNVLHLSNQPEEPRDEYTEDDIRKNAFVMAFTATSMCYADNDGYSSSGFSGTMELDQRKQVFHDILKGIWDFMETLPFERMKPDHDFASRGWCLSIEKELYVTYLNTPGEVVLNLDNFQDYRIQWINPQKTSERKPARRKAKTSNTFATPAGGDDWLLQVSRK